MSQVIMLREIKGFIRGQWERIVQDAEQNSGCDPADLRSRAGDIHHCAQTQLIHELVNMKGEWLTAVELEYALDLFNTICLTSVEYFSGLKDQKGSTNILREFRKLVQIEMMRA